MLNIEFTLFLAAILSIILYFIIPKKARKLPPGPRGLPIIGNALSIDENARLTFAKWIKEFGDIITVQIFGTRLVIIADTNLAREAFNKPTLLGRAFIEPFEVYFRGDKEYPKEVARGVLSSEGPHWVEQRRFTLRHLRDFGFGKQNCMEEHIQAESAILLSSLQKLNGKAIDLWRPFAEASSNVLWRIVAGERLTQDEEKSRTINLSLKYLLDMVDTPSNVHLPGLTKLFGEYTGWNNLKKFANKMHNILREYVVQHEKDFSDENAPRDFIDAYLKKISETTESSSSFYGQNGVDSLKLLVSDLFIAGSETVSATMNWAVLYLTNFQETQKRLLEEITDVIGNTRIAEAADRAKMPFTEAVINEVLRKSSFTTYGVMHRATDDTELNGYEIPKDTWVCVNQHFIHHDPRVWGDPENFRPERFLTKNSDGTNSLRKYEELVPFSIGKRLCIGAELAKDEVFLFLCTIYQNYSTEFDPASPKPSLESRTGMFRYPDLYKVILNARQ